jgi:hypothetical protein
MRQAWCGALLGTGGTAAGRVPWAPALVGPPALRMMIPAVGSGRPHHGTILEFFGTAVSVGSLPLPRPRPDASVLGRTRRARA